MTKSRSRIQGHKTNPKWAALGLVLLLGGTWAASGFYGGGLSYTDIATGGSTRYSFWGYAYDSLLGGSFTAINGTVGATLQGLHCNNPSPLLDPNGNPIPPTGCWWPVNNDPNQGFYGDVNVGAFFWPYVYLHTGIKQTCTSGPACVGGDTQFLQAVIFDTPFSLRPVTVTYPNATSKTVMSEFGMGWAWCGSLGGDCAQGINIPIAPFTTHQLGLFYRNNGWDIVLDGATMQHFDWNYKAYEVGYVDETHCLANNPFCDPRYVITGLSSARLSVVQDNLGKEDFTKVPPAAALLFSDNDGTANGANMVCTNPPYIQVGGGLQPPLPQNCLTTFALWSSNSYIDANGVTHTTLSPSGQQAPSGPCFYCNRKTTTGFFGGGTTTKGAFVETITPSQEFPVFQIGPPTAPSIATSTSSASITSSSSSTQTTTKTLTASSVSIQTSSATTSAVTYSSIATGKGQPLLVISQSQISWIGIALAVVGGIILIVSLL